MVKKVNSPSRPERFITQPGSSRHFLTIPDLSLFEVLFLQHDRNQSAVMNAVSRFQMDTHLRPVEELPHVMHPQLVPFAGLPRAVRRLVLHPRVEAASGTRRRRRRVIFVLVVGLLLLLLLLLGPLCLQLWGLVNLPSV